MARDTGLHVLHIGKTGGTTLRTMVKEHEIRTTPAGRPVVMHGHQTTLPEVFSRDRRCHAAFFLREPLSRFVSGFNSRLRQGEPERSRPWRPEEAFIFRHFTTPNDLAEALTASRSLVRDRAYFALQSLPHCRNRMAFYLQSPEYLEERVDRLAFLGFHQTYADDLLAFLRVLSPGTEFQIEHRGQAPSTSSVALSEVASANLRSWFADDIRIYEWALSKRDLFTADRAMRLLGTADVAGTARSHLSLATDTSPRQFVRPATPEPAGGDEAGGDEAGADEVGMDEVGMDEASAPRHRTA